MIKRFANLRLLYSESSDRTFTNRTVVVLCVKSSRTQKKPGTERVQALAVISRSRYVVIANPPNSAQLGAALTTPPKLHPGKCNSVGLRPRTGRHKDAGDHNTFRVACDSGET